MRLLHYAIPGIVVASTSLSGESRSCPRSLRNYNSDFIEICPEGEQQKMTIKLNNRCEYTFNDYEDSNPSLIILSNRLEQLDPQYISTIKCLQAFEPRKGTAFNKAAIKKHRSENSGGVYYSVECEGSSTKRHMTYTEHAKKNESLIKPILIHRPRANSFLGKIKETVSGMFRDEEEAVIGQQDYFIKKSDAIELCGRMENADDNIRNGVSSAITRPGDWKMNQPTYDPKCQSIQGSFVRFCDPKEDSRDFYIVLTGLGSCDFILNEPDKNSAEVRSNALKHSRETIGADSLNCNDFTERGESADDETRKDCYIARNRFIVFYKTKEYIGSVIAKNGGRIKNNVNVCEKLAERKKLIDDRLFNTPKKDECRSLGAITLCKTSLQIIGINGVCSFTYHISSSEYEKLFEMRNSLKNNWRSIHCHFPDIGDTFFSQTRTKVVKENGFYHLKCLSFLTQSEEGNVALSPALFNSLIKAQGDQKTSSLGGLFANQDASPVENLDGSAEFYSKKNAEKLCRSFNSQRKQIIQQLLENTSKMHRSPVLEEYFF